MPRHPDRLLLTLLTCYVALLTLVGCSTPTRAKDDPKFDVKLLIFTAFDPELRIWVERKPITQTFRVEGLTEPIRCTEQGVCIMMTQMGKANAAVAVSTLLSDPPFDLSRAIFMTAGLAGGPPEMGTLGAVAWADYVIDFDLFHHLVLDRETCSQEPLVERQVEPVGTELFTLNNRLVDLAYRVTKATPLIDTERARAYRTQFTGQAGRKPSVLQCDTVSSDIYWHGRRLSLFASQLVKAQTKGAGTYCTTEMEGSATAGALAHFGYLNRYLSLRAIGNFDQPYPGQPVRESLRHLHRNIAAENLFRVGDAFVQYLLAHRDEVLATTDQ